MFEALITEACGRPRGHSLVEFSVCKPAGLHAYQKQQYREGDPANRLERKNALFVTVVRASPCRSASVLGLALNRARRNLGPLKGVDCQLQAIASPTPPACDAFGPVFFLA
jgi:hypothetical protein